MLLKNKLLIENRGIIMEKIRMNISAPNIMCVCIDGREEGDSRGRLYCCYSEREVPFDNEYQLLQIMEGLMEQIDYPQSSVQIRSFSKVSGNKKKEELAKVMDGRAVVSHLGKVNTFIIHIQYRQNATWQGEILWVEQEKKEKFRSALELLKLFENAMDISDVRTHSEGN